MKRHSKKHIDAAVKGLSDCRAVLDGSMEAPPSPWAKFEGVPVLRTEDIVEEAPLEEPPPVVEGDWNRTRKDLG